MPELVLPEPVSPVILPYVQTLRAKPFRSLAGPASAAITSLGMNQTRRPRRTDGNRALPLLVSQPAQAWTAVWSPQEFQQLWGVDQVVERIQLLARCRRDIIAR